MTITDTQARTPPALDLSRHSLFLDLDGTLAPIVARPSDVGPDPRRTAILEALVRRMDGRVAILSGRTLAEVDHICLLYTSPSPRDRQKSRMPSSA